MNQNISPVLSTYNAAPRASAANPEIIDWLPCIPPEKTLLIPPRELSIPPTALVGAVAVFAVVRESHVSFACFERTN